MKLVDEAIADLAVPELIEIGRQEAPQEACGLIEWDGHRTTVHRLLNVSDSPEDSFLCDPLEQRRALEEIFDRGTELWALWHTHPSQGSQPSERDRAFAARVGSLRWLIVGLDPVGYWVGRP